MVQVNVSDFRENLPSIMDRVIGGEEFEVLRNRMVIARVSPAKKRMKSKLNLSAFGMWKNRKDMQGPIEEVAARLRERAWKGDYDNR